MSQSSFPELRAFIVKETARKPKPTAKSTQSKHDTANGLTRKIVAHIRANGGFATRISSTGTYRADLKKFVASQQVSGLPDVMGILDSRSLWVEVKTPNDKLSDQQKQTIAALEKAGAWVFVARDFQSFYEWFVAEFQTAHFA